MTERVNGYPIIGQVLTLGGNGTREGRVILVDRGEDAYDRYVTAWQGRDATGWDSCWYMGNYWNSMEDALEDFFNRVGRYLE